MSAAFASGLGAERKNTHADLQKRLLFVLFGIFVFRLGAHIPVPGVNVRLLADLFNQHKTGILGLFNMFSGGALSRLTVFALGVMPYITSSIIMQLPDDNCLISFKHRLRSYSVLVHFDEINSYFYKFSC